MSPAEIAVLISGGAFIVALVGGVVARDRYIQKQITDGDANVAARAAAEDHALATKISENTKDLHKRVDDLRNDTVRPHEHDKAVARMERMVSSLTTTVGEQNKALTSALAEQSRMQTERYDKLVNLIANRPRGPDS